MPEDKVELPKSDKWDIVHKAGKIGAAVAGGATMIPGLSELASELYLAIIKPPLVKRTDEFLVRIYGKLIELEQKVEGFSIESLRDNQLFISIIWQATQKALYNHQQDKLEALQNAVLNSAIRIDIDENMQLILLRYIDDFTPLHLKMMALLNNPKGYLQKVNRVLANNVTGIALESLIQHAIPELHKKHEYIRIIFHDLYNFGLVSTSPDSLVTSMTISNDGIYAQRTTDMARVFLRYISTPEELTP